MIAVEVACEALYEAEGALKVCIRDARKNPAPGDYDEKNGNYLNFPLAEAQIWRIANPRPKKRHYGGANLENCKFAPFTIDGWMRNIVYSSTIHGGKSE